VSIKKLLWLLCKNCLFMKFTTQKYSPLNRSRWCVWYKSTPYIFSERVPLRRQLSWWVVSFFQLVCSLIWFKVGFCTWPLKWIAEKIVLEMCRARRWTVGIAYLIPFQLVRFDYKGLRHILPHYRNCFSQSTRRRTYKDAEQKRGYFTSFKHLRWYPGPMYAPSAIDFSRNPGTA